MSTTTSGPGRTRQRAIWQLTEPLFQRGAHLLAQAAREQYGPITAVIGIGKGGRVCAYAVAASLNVRAFIVTAGYSTRGSVYQQGGGGRVDVDVDDFHQHIARAGSLHGTVLVVDDVCNSGATLRAVRTALETLLDDDAEVATAVLCRTVGATADPDLWLWNVRDAVIFPWEQAKTPATGVLPDVHGVQP
jgi:hypoxanthine phosphoribosyltransferase